MLPYRAFIYLLRLCFRCFFGVGETKHAHWFVKSNFQEMSVLHYKLTRYWMDECVSWTWPRSQHVVIYFSWWLRFSLIVKAVMKMRFEAPFCVVVSEAERLQRVIADKELDDTMLLRSLQELASNISSLCREVEWCCAMGQSAYLLKCFLSWDEGGELIRMTQDSPGTVISFIYFWTWIFILRWLLF